MTENIGEFWHENRPTAFNPNPAPCLCLGWSSGTRSKQQGTDLASVLARLPTDRLAFWRERFKKSQLVHELTVMDAEIARRRVAGWARAAGVQLTLFPEDVAK